MATRKETAPTRTHAPGSTKTRAATTDWENMPGWTLCSVRDIMHLTGLSKTALNERIADGRFPQPSKHGKDRVWSLGQVRTWCQSVIGEAGA